MKRPMRLAHAYKISIFLVVLHLRHIALKRSEVGGGEHRHGDADGDRLKRKTSYRDALKVRSREGCDPHLPVRCGDHKTLMLKHTQRLAQGGASCAKGACEV